MIEPKVVRGFNWVNEDLLEENPKDWRRSCKALCLIVSDLEINSVGFFHR